MNEVIIMKIVTISGPLLGAFIGAFIASVSSTRLERLRWQNERQEKLSNLQREALVATLKWIGLMRKAEIRASFLIMAAIQGNFNHSEFMKDFPYLLGELSKNDLTADQRAVLPSGFYARGTKIALEISNLKTLGIKYGQETTIMKNSTPGFIECNNKLDDVNKQISKLEKDLTDSFKNTFN